MGDWSRSSHSGSFSYSSSSSSSTEPPPHSSHDKIRSTNPRPKRFPARRKEVVRRPETHQKLTHKAAFGRLGLHQKTSSLRTCSGNPGPRSHFQQRHLAKNTEESSRERLRGLSKAHVGQPEPLRFGLSGCWSRRINRAVSLSKSLASEAALHECHGASSIINKYG
jgi:hypothetical protein